MKDDYFVAPHTLKSNTDLRNPEKKIDLYEKRLFGWFIDIAKALKVNPGDPNGGPGADPASLLIAMSLFEPLGVYLQGENAPIHTKSGEPKARENFEHGFKHFLEKIHSELSKAQREEIAEWMYRQVRCGLFHLNTAKRGIWYDRGTNSQPTPSMAVKRLRVR